MELITKNYFYTIVPTDNKEWNMYRLRLPDLKISQCIYGLNYVLIDDNIPAAYISVLDQLIIPKTYGELSKDRLKRLESEDLTINTWEITELKDFKGECILTRNELTRVPYGDFGDDFHKKINDHLPLGAFTIKSNLDTSLKEEFVQIIQNPVKYSYYRKKIICNSCVKTSIIPEDFWLNYFYNIIMLIINLKYLKNVDISERNN
jgi:hypothetical protein